MVDESRVLAPPERMEEWLRPDVQAVLVRCHGHDAHTQLLIVSRQRSGVRLILYVSGIIEGHEPQRCVLTEYGKQVVEYLATK